MKCPMCKEKSGVELNMHSDGFAPKETPAKECSHCGTVWTAKNGEVSIIKEGTKKTATAV